jgi:tRNA nucleotidyltransferase (CCA-adding enzyme)
MMHPAPSSVELPPGPLLDKARVVAQAAAAQGGRALLVGGYVRDALLGLDPKDGDLEVYGIAAPALRELLARYGRVNCVGESYRVYKLSWRQAGSRHELDVSLPRHDKKIAHGHRGFEVTGNPDATFSDAARRRDFTINAIMADPGDGSLIDPFAGRADLEARLLRVVDERHFGEDSLRVLRAVQFAARFNLAIEPGTLALCRSISLADLPRERVWLEWEKLLLKAERPSLGLQTAQAMGVLGQLFPYLDAAMTGPGQALAVGAALDAAVAEASLREPEVDVLKPELSHAQKLALALATLATYCSGDLRRFLDDLNVHSWEGYRARATVTALVRERDAVAALAGRAAAGDAGLDGELRRLSGRCEPRLWFHLARVFGQRDAASWFWLQIERLGLQAGAPVPLLGGRHLLEMGLPPGPLVGRIVREVYELQLDGRVDTLQAAQAAARKLLPPSG